MDRIQPGLVKWRNTHAKPKGRIHEVDNCNMVVALAREMDLVTVNIGGTDLVDGNKTLILAVVWQLMRRFTLNVLKELSSTTGGTTGKSQRTEEERVSERHVVAWANRQVEQGARRLPAGGPAPKPIKNLQDRSLASGAFLVHLCGGVNPRAVDWSLVAVEPSSQGGLSEEGKRANARYAISVARKMGACVFLQPEDVTEVKPKMLFSFMASIWVECLRQGLATAPVDQTPPAASSSPSTPASSNSSPCSPRAAASALAAPTSKAVPRTRLTRVWPPPSPSCDAASIPPKASPKARASPVRRWPPVSPSASSPVPPAFLPKPSPPQTPPRRGPSSVSSTAPASALDDEEEDENPFGTAAAALLKTPEKEKGGAGLASANGPGLEGGGGATARAARAARAARDQGADVGDSEWD
mmetsp:Transcript_11882/g.17871  ORF Transcript_11882/g.17871 Transcript_11882/m.17871 type:complete len:413 (+) Transcript_11882:184-1422(+)